MDVLHLYTNVRAVDRETPSSSSNSNCFSVCLDAKYNSLGIDEHAACDGVIDHMLLYYLSHFRRCTVTSEVQHCF